MCPQRTNDGAAPIPAAEYVRMSTEHQRYSIMNQSDAIHEYARANDIEIVRTYSDAGRSGLNIKGRPALKQLIEDVESGRADFEIVLVFDVSRWGRFQDIDEAAHYEFLCRRAGIDVHYCTETFENDGSPMSVLIKNIKRSMAAEYSRELSSKRFKGQVRLSKLGFKAGGKAVYGLRRLLVDDQGNPKHVLKPGEYKYLMTDRVKYIPGPEEEIKVVSSIFRMFVNEGLSEANIARRLNKKGVPPPSGEAWKGHHLRQILNRETYIGTSVYNKTTQRFKTNAKRVPRNQWVVTPHAFTPILSARLYRKAQKKIERRRQRYTDDEALAMLKGLLDKKGRLSRSLILADKSLPAVSSYERRFGGLIGAYEAIGYEDYERERHRFHIAMGDARVAMCQELVEYVHSQGISARRTTRAGSARINSRFNVRTSAGRFQNTKYAPPYWQFTFLSQKSDEFILAVCMDEELKRPLRRYLFPKSQFAQEKIRVSAKTASRLSRYRVREDADVLKLLHEYNDLGGSTHGIALRLAVGNLNGWDKASRGV